MNKNLQVGIIDFLNEMSPLKSSQIRVALSPCPSNRAHTFDEAKLALMSHATPQNEIRLTYASCPQNGHKLYSSLSYPTFPQMESKKGSLVGYFLALLRRVCIGFHVSLGEGIYKRLGIMVFLGKSFPSL